MLLLCLSNLPIKKNRTYPLLIPNLDLRLADPVSWNTSSASSIAGSFHSFSISGLFIKTPDKVSRGKKKKLKHGILVEFALSSTHHRQQLASWLKLWTHHPEINTGLTSSRATKQNQNLINTFIFPSDDIDLTKKRFMFH